MYRLSFFIELKGLIEFCGLGEVLKGTSLPILKQHFVAIDRRLDCVGCATWRLI